MVLPAGPERRCQSVEMMPAEVGEDKKRVIWERRLLR